MPVTVKRSSRNPNNDPQSSDSRFAVAKSMARGLAAKFQPETHLEQARSFCFEMLSAYWGARCRSFDCKWALAAGPTTTPPKEPASRRLAAELGTIAKEFADGKASYLLGTVYTGMLPSGLRSEWGAFYTPPPYVDRLMDVAGMAGFDWARGRVIDPACGGGAFLTPVALRMLAAMQGGSAEFRLARIVARLRGAELDSFAAWMSHVLLEAALLPLCVEAKKRLPSVITVGDSLDLTNLKGFDLVIGNPPYGRVTLAPERRERYARSLFGHANLYGLFTDLAIRLAKPGGIIAYVTPTSFLGGQYFKGLRELLVKEAPPRCVDFVRHRDGVFDDVLQETMLAVYRKGATATNVEVSCLEPIGTDFVAAASAGSLRVAGDGQPWLLPRSVDQAKFFSKLQAMSCRLAECGYAVSTGPLVWNRHKGQLRSLKQGKGVHPLVWAESVTANRFTFKAERRNHVPYLQVTTGQSHLLAHDACVLVQRTTSKEQDRRLVAAVMPADFVKKHGGAVVENHLNMVYAVKDQGISPETIAALLNSHALDTAFRCISGSVAVSAYELNALPLPDLKDLLSIQMLVQNGADQRLIEKRLNKMYGL